MGFIGCAILTMCVRGPKEDGWIGWKGGWSMIKKNKSSADGKTSEVAHHTEGVKRGKDEEMGGQEVGAEEKRLEEVAAECGNEEPLHEDRSEKSRSSSGKEGIRTVKM